MSLLTVPLLDSLSAGQGLSQLVTAVFSGGLVHSRRSLNVGRVGLDGERERTRAGGAHHPASLPSDLPEPQPALAACPW